jgi:hypothetical protein
VIRGQTVDEFMDSISSEAFDELVAMNEIIPFGDEKVCRVLALGFAAMVMRLDIILRRWCEMKDLPKITPDSFIPWSKKKKKKPKSKYVNPNAMATAFKMAVR